MGLSSWFAERNGIASPPPSSASVVAQSDERSFFASDSVVAALLGYPVGSAPVISETLALNLSAVFRAASLVAGAIGGLPLRTLEADAEGQTRVVSSWLDDVGGDRYTPVEWAETSMLHLLFRGTTYQQHIRNAAGGLVALYPVHPGSVETSWDDSRPGGKAFRVHQEDGTTVTLDARTMTQVMGPSLDGLTGVSMLSQARISLGGALAGDKAASRQMTNGSMLSGFVTPADNEADLDPDEAAQVKDVVNRKMVGPETAGDIAVLSRALKFNPWQMTAADAQFLESRTFSVDEVGRWFGIPPHLLGLVEKSTSWGQGIAEQNRGLARYTLQPWTGRLEARLGRLLPPGRTAQFDYTAFVRPSPEDEVQLLVTQVNAGLITPNEARAARNLRPVAGGDVLRIPAGAADPNRPAQGGQGGPPTDGGAP